jgi:hypothetical protein
VLAELSAERKKGLQSPPSCHPAHALELAGACSQEVDELLRGLGRVGDHPSVCKRQRGNGHSVNERQQHWGCWDPRIAERRKPPDHLVVFDGDSRS